MSPLLGLEDHELRRNGASPRRAEIIQIFQIVTSSVNLHAAHKVTDNDAEQLVLRERAPGLRMITGAEGAVVTAASDRRFGAYLRLEALPRPCT